MFPSPCRTIHISVMHNICKINSQMSRMFIHRLYSLHKLLTLVILKELVHPKMTIFQTSKTFVGTQIKILFMHSERSLTLHRQQGSLHVAKKKVVIFVFFTHKKYSHSFIKLWLNHRIILTISWLHFWALIVSGPVRSMEGQKALGFHQKYLNLCSEDEQTSYGFGTTWGWAINDRIDIFGERSLC